MFDHLVGLTLKGVILVNSETTSNDVFTTADVCALPFQIKKFMVQISLFWQKEIKQNEAVCQYAQSILS